MEFVGEGMVLRSIGVIMRHFRKGWGGDRKRIINVLNE